jgi:hypothetical protein
MPAILEAQARGCRAEGYLEGSEKRGQFLRSRIRTGTEENYYAVSAPVELSHRGKEGRLPRKVQIVGDVDIGYTVFEDSGRRVYAVDATTVVGGSKPLLILNSDEQFEFSMRATIVLFGSLAADGQLQVSGESKLLDDAGETQASKTLQIPIPDDSLVRDDHEIESRVREWDSARIHLVIGSFTR